MLEIKHPFSIWLQISSFSFFMAGHFSDLLIIRLCLTSAYVFLFLNSALGGPLWPLLSLEGKVQLDGMIWALLNLYVHISTVARLFNDEVQVKLSQDEEALWRMFYRTGGLSEKMFQKLVAKHCTVVTYGKNESIDTDKYFFIMYKGTVKLTVTDDNGAIVSSRRAQSGQIFDFRALGLLVDHQSLARHRLEAVVAVSNVTVFRFPKEQMPTIASHPSTRVLWKEILMENLLRIVQRYFDKRMRHRNVVDGVDQYVNPIFAPLQPWEYPDPLRAGSGLALRRPLAHIRASMVWSWAPPWPFRGPPEGLRHNQLLSTGRVQGMAPRTLLDASESRSLMGTPDSSVACDLCDMDYQSITSGEDESFLEYLHEIDEEMGGIDIIGFKRDVSMKIEEAPDQPI